MATIKNCTCFITSAAFIDCLNEITTKKEEEAKEGKKLTRVSPEYYCLYIIYQ